MKGTGQPDDVTLLTITSGLFAQFALSTKLDPGFKEIADLGSVATSMVRNFDTEIQKSGFENLDTSASNICHNTQLLRGTEAVSCQQVCSILLCGHDVTLREIQC